MSAFRETELAFYIDLKSNFHTTGLKLPIEIIGKPLKEDEKGKVWLGFFFLPGPSAVYTLGDAGTDRNLGVYQVDINCAVGNGVKDLYSITDLLCSHYYAGLDLHYQGQAVTITGVSRSPVRNVGNWMRISVSVSYDARTNRIKQP